MSKSYVQDLLDQRARAWEQAKEILDRCATDKRERTVEEDAAYARANEDIVRLGRLADEWLDNQRVQKELDTAREAIESIVRPEVDQARGRSQASAMERYMRTGDTTGLPVSVDGGRAGVEVDLTPSVRMFNAIRQGMDAREARAIYQDGGASAGSLVIPTTFANSLYQYMEANSAIRQISRVITTQSGEPMSFPKVGTHGVGTRVIAEGTVIGGTDPVFALFTLNAYKYGQLVRVSNEAAADLGFDLLGFVAENIGRAVGRITDTQYVSGDGSGDPNGVVTAATVGATTGGSLIALGGGAAAAATGNIDCLINLQHSIVSSYRNNNSAWVMHDSTAGTIRKLKDGGNGTIGAYIWTPNTTIDSASGNRMPDRLLGDPVYTDVNFGTNGSAVKPVAYGDWSAYWVRDSGSFRLERSDERYFDSDEIGFRGLLRTDSDLADANAIKTLQQAV